MLLALAAPPMAAEGAGVSERAAPWDLARIVPLAAGESLPTPQELEARGAVIGEILVKVYDVFDPADPREDSWIYRTANVLHYKTRGYALDPVPREPVPDRGRNKARVLIGSGPGGRAGIRS